MLENIFGPRHFIVKIVNLIFKVKTLTLQQLFTSAGMLTRPCFLTYDQQHALPRSEPVVFWTALNKSHERNWLIHFHLSYSHPWMGRGSIFLCKLKSGDTKLKPCSAVLIHGWIIAYRKQHLLLRKWNFTSGYVRQPERGKQ